jgi:hypothetical protein
MLEALTKMLKKQNEAQQEALKNVKGSAFSAARHRTSAKRRTRSVKSLAYISRANIPAGKLALRLHLNRAALTKLAGRHNSVALVVRVNMRIPSPSLPAGETRVILKRITLKRAPRRRRKP